MYNPVHLTFLMSARFGHETYPMSARSIQFQASVHRHNSQPRREAHEHFIQDEGFGFPINIAHIARSSRGNTIIWRLEALFHGTSVRTHASANQVGSIHHLFIEDHDYPASTSVYPTPVKSIKDTALSRQAKRYLFATAPVPTPKSRPEKSVRHTTPYHPNSFTSHSSARSPR
ncbi:hypothetical protein BDZ97DRAFT_72595 [Flammula alnicola]|nr:hypothetical protein BDZ97DRAFT_72595 [Flammula alnicola]